MPAALPGIIVHLEKHVVASGFSAAAIPGSTKGFFFSDESDLMTLLLSQGSPDTSAQAAPLGLENTGSPGEGSRESGNRFIQLCLLEYKFSGIGGNSTCCSTLHSPEKSLSVL